jgi:hypothetical protein
MLKLFWSTKIHFCVVRFSSLKGPPIALNCLFCISLNCCYTNSRWLELMIQYVHALAFVQIRIQLGWLYMAHCNVLLVMQILWLVSGRKWSKNNKIELKGIKLNFWCTDRSPRTLVESESTISCMYTVYPSEDENLMLETCRGT